MNIHKKKILLDDLLAIYPNSQKLKSKEEADKKNNEQRRWVKTNKIAKKNRLDLEQRIYNSHCKKTTKAKKEN